MVRAVSVLLLSALVLTSCGGLRDSRLNPMNWFGRGVSEPVSASAEVNPLIPRRRASIFRSSQDDSYQGRLVGEISELLIERRPGGAVIRASAVANRQGPFEVRLVKNEAESDADTLTYDFRALQQPGRVGSEWSRTVSAGIWLTDNELAGIREIRVRGQRNVQVSRR